MKILIIGGYGTFGLRIARGLADEAGLHITLAGRSLEKAKRACETLSGAAMFHPLKLDREKIALEQQPDLIIDASGPFQAYAGNPVLGYCLEQGVDYADLSDDGTFVQSVIDRHEAVEHAAISACSGLSTCPVLSAIGLREIEARIGPVKDVMIGIAPSPKADLGKSVVAAVMNYAGQSTVPVRRDNDTERVAGLTEIRDATICAPGDIPLPRLPFAVADAPDALVLPHRFTKLRDIWTGAGTRPVWLHRLLIILARGISFKVLPKLSRFSSFFHWVRGFFRFGQHRGGMIVAGRNDAGAASWHLVAEGDHGPYVPTLPAVALVKKYLNDNPPAKGAYSGDQLITLSDLVPEFEKLDIAYGLQYDQTDLPVYQAVLGDAAGSLFPAVRELHRTDQGRSFRGLCHVTRGNNPLSHIVSAIMGFPKSGENVPVTVTITPTDSGENWARNFDGRRFSSHHRLGTGRWERHVTEQFGPISIHMAVLEEAGKLRIETQGWSIFGIALPRFLKPGGDVFETEDDRGRFNFHVDLTAPIFGRLCKYEGYLVPEPNSKA